MAHPFFGLPGADAYRRGDFAEAADYWSKVHLDRDSSLDGDRRTLFRALAELADGLAAGQAGDLETAQTGFEASREHLVGLPSPLAGVDLDALRHSLERPTTTLTVDPPSLPAAPRIPRKILLRFAALIILAVVGVVALTSTPLGDLLDRERLVAVLDQLRDAWWTPLALIGLYLIISPIGLPVSPLMFAGGVVFGAGAGGGYNVLGTFLGAALSFFVGKLLGRDLVEHLAGPRLRKVERIIARQGFWPLAGVRFLPIPFPIINYGAALAGVKTPTFLLTSAIGLAPSVLIWTYLASSVFATLVEGREDVSLRGPILALAGVFLLSFLPSFIQGRRRAKRYRQLLEQRAERG